MPGSPLRICIISWDSHSNLYKVNTSIIAICISKETEAQRGKVIAPVPQQGTIWTQMACFQNPFVG